MSALPSDNLNDEIRELIVLTLKLEDIQPMQIDVEENLFDGGLGLDSIDALELGVALRRKYGITIETATDEVKSYFRNVLGLAAFVRMKRER